MIAERLLSAHRQVQVWGSLQVGASQLHLPAKLQQYVLRDHTLSMSVVYSDRHGSSGLSWTETSYLMSQLNMLIHNDFCSSVCLGGVIYTIV